MTRSLLVAAAASLLFLRSATAQGVLEGQPCNLDRNRLTSTAHQFLSDCVPTAYCDSVERICKPKGCRTEEFPIGYGNRTDLPPMCPDGQFCPDEEDGCLPVQAVGQPCQLNRDDQCQRPPQWPPAPTMASMYNNFGAVCLKFQCYWQNVTEGGECIVDNVVYTGFRTDASEFATIISRDNCFSPGLYCDAQTNTCKASLQLGQACGSDKECDSGNCGTDNTCKVPAGTVIKIPFWQYIVTGVGIVAFILIILITLFLVHRRQRAHTQREIREYFHEQTTYRSSIIALHTAARERTSMYGGSDSQSRLSQYDEHGQMVYSDDDSARHLLYRTQSADVHDPRRRSQLRQSIVADDESEDNHGLLGGGPVAGPSGGGRGPFGGGPATRDSFDQETPRPSFDYGAAGGTGYAAVPLRGSMDMPQPQQSGSGGQKRPEGYQDPWGN